MISVRRVPFDDAAARSLWDAQQAELFARYGEEDIDATIPDEGIIASFVGERDGVPIATALLRWSPYDTAPGAAEVKRLYVVPEHRGHGHSRVMMGEVEAVARRAGVTSIVLETGVKQPEAIALYEGIGYSRIAAYGAYRDSPDSVCLAKELPTRVLIVNGTVGAGKTQVAGAIHDLLAARGARTAYIDGDYLCQAEPPVPGPPYNQALLFDNLAAVAPVYRAAGYGLMVIARVVEDPADRARHGRAFASPGGPADVTIVRLTVPEDERMRRLEAREANSSEEWQRWARARTVELEAALVDADLDDAVVENTGGDARATAVRVLDAAGW